MSWFGKAFSSSIGKKVIMALTGLFLVIFVLEHLLSNLLLLSNDPSDFNGYAEFMSTNIFIRAAEYILFAGFIIHIVYAAIVTYKNNKARPTGYAVNKPNDNSTWVSRNM
ncbi:MAG TPA: succinate dehydrogenase, partial [Cytophagaceae bacterium]